MITKALKNLKRQSESTGEAWRIVGNEIIKGSAGSVTYTEQDIVELPLDMLTDEEPTIEQVREILKGKVLASELTAEEVAAITDLYPPWQVGLVITQDDVDLQNIYSHEGLIYRPLSAHTTQSDWTPDITASLWVRADIPDTIPDWEQPTSEKYYSYGDLMRYTDGLVYRSIYQGANVWSPEAYPQGWNWLYGI